MQALPSNPTGPSSRWVDPLGFSLLVLFLAPRAAMIPYRVYLTNDLQSWATLGLGLVSSGAWWWSSRSAPPLRFAREPIADSSLVGFVALAILSTALAADPFASLRWLFALAVGLVVYGITHRLAVDENRLRALLDHVITVGAAVAALQVAAWTLGSRVLHLPLVPFFMNRNRAALLLLLPVCLAFAQILRRRQGRLFLWDVLRIFVMATALVLARSRAVWLGLAVAAAAWTVLDLSRSRSYRPRRLGAHVIAAAVVACAAIAASTLLAAYGLPSPLEVVRSLASPFEGSAGGRLRRWQNGLALLGDHLWLGVGPGRWLEAFPGVRHLAVPDAPGYPFPLNGHLELLAELGLPAYLAFACFVASLLAPRAEEGAERRTLRFALVAWLIAAFFHTVFYERSCQLALWFHLGLLAATRPAARAISFRRERALAAAACAVLVVGVAVESRFTWAALHDHVVSAWIRYDRSDPPLVLPRGLGWLVPAVRVGMPGVFYREEGPALRRAAGVAVGRPLHLFSRVAARELRAGRPTEALTWLQAAESVVGKTSRDEQRRCIAESQLGRHDLARDSCRRGLARWPDDPDLWFAMADLEREAGRTQEALRALDRARRGHRSRMSATVGFYGLGIAKSRQAALERIEHQETSLRQNAEIPREEGEMLDAIAWVPQVHKSIAADDGGVFYTTNATGRYQLWYLPLPGAAPAAGPPRLLSAVSHAPFRLRRHPDLRRLYFLADHLGDARYQLYVLDLRTSLARRLTSRDGQGEYELSPDGSWVALQREQRGRHQLCLMKAPGGEERCLVEGARAIRDLAWRPDSRGIAFVEDDDRLIEVSLDASRRELARFGGSTLATPVYSPNGDRLLVVARDRGERGTLYEIRVAGGDSRAVTAAGHDVLTPLWLDERTILHREKVEDRYELVRLDLLAGEERRVDAGGVVYPMIRRNGVGDVFYLRSDDETPMTLERIPAADGGPETVLTIADPEPETIVVGRRIDLAVDGRPVRTWLYEPPEGSTPAPKTAAVWLHGAGGEFSPRWNPYARALVRAGFVFAALNYSTRRGGGGVDDEESELRAQAVEVEALRKFLITERGVDPGRIALLGVSQGTRTIHRVLGDHANDYFGVVEIAPAPSDAWQAPRADLPPTLAFLGDRDPLVDARRRSAEIEAQGDAGTPVRVVRFADEGHDVRRPANLARQLAETVAFLRQAAGD